VSFKAKQGIFEQSPTCYQDDIVDFLLCEYGICVHQNMVYRVMQGPKQTYKRIERLFPETSNVKRAHFRSEVVEYKANQIIFVNESAANERTGDRR
jgi:Zn-finger domain-containing protein